jgi:HAD superfamily hydrolase (TIGR01549 family)
MQILSKYELFVFDWDHTLTTSTFVVTLLNLLKEKRQKRSIGTRREVQASESAIRNVKVEEKIGRLYSTFDDAYGILFKPKLKRNADLVLELLKRHRKKVAIFSDSKNYRLLKETGALRVLRYVDFALSAEAIGYYKPNPTGLLVLLDRFRIAKSKCLYIGDMATDVLTAKLAGVDSCAVADGIGSFETLSAAGPNYLFTKMEAFLQALKGRR